MSGALLWSVGALLTQKTLIIHYSLLIIPTLAQEIPQAGVEVFLTGTPT